MFILCKKGKIKNRFQEYAAFSEASQKYAYTGLLQSNVNIHKKATDQFYFLIIVTNGNCAVQPYKYISKLLIKLFLSCIPCLQSIKWNANSIDF